MRSIEGHPDFGILERRLVDLVRAHRAEAGAPASGRAAAGAPLPAGLAPLAIVAPTRRLLAHLRVRLASEFPALLGVHFFHHDSLAHAAANAAGIVLPRSLPDSVKEAILLEAIRAAGGALATYVHDRPGSVAALLASIEDLREAGVDPEAALRAPGLERAGRDLLSLYSAYAARLDRLAARGVSDRSGALRAALPHVRAFGRRFHLVVHYGAYELIGANLALLRALQESGAPLVDLTPFHATAPAYGYARGFWREFVGTLPAEIRSGGPSDRLLGDRLPGLYDEAAEPPKVDTARIDLFHAQGAAAELREVALRILALHRDEKIALRDIAVVARTLEPYASLLEPVFSEHGLPFVTTATLGALREARVQATLHLVRCVTGDFERQPLIDLCRSGLLDLKTADAGHAAHEWDRLSREWQVAGGFDVWTRDLPRWLEGWEPWLPDDADAASRAGAALLKEGRLRQARSLAAAVGEMRSAARPLLESSGWQAFSEALRALAGALLGLALDERDDQVLEHGEAAVADALAALRDLE
ncbi:MAG TPA: hypothetical protein VFT43_10670, partial [Candidatus Polarisedimenticolia bacterium]|nr:hypothetical protein [Candidatus Polarisedimenticolia bacterium]